MAIYLYDNAHLILHVDIFSPNPDIFLSKDLCIQGQHGKYSGENQNFLRHRSDITNTGIGYILGLYLPQIETRLDLLGDSIWVSWWMYFAIGSGVRLQQTYFGFAEPQIRYVVHVILHFFQLYFSNDHRAGLPNL